MLKQFTKKRHLVIGVAPLRRTAWTHKPFNQPVAVSYKERILAFLKRYEALDVSLVDLEGLTDDGLLSAVEDAQRVADVFLEKKVDAIFAPHCNFGSEEALARLCQSVRKPVLLWGPKDDINPDDLYRYRDSQCGLFASSKVLQMYHIPFSYIENCDLEDPVLDSGFRRFLAVVSTVKAFRGMRIGQIGTRPGPFASVKANEMELLSRFGIEIVPITLEDLRRMVEKVRKDREDRVRSEAQSMQELYQLTGGTTPEHLEKAAALKLAVEDWAVRESLSAAVAMCWGPMIEATGIAPCFVLGDVCDDGFPFICETDIHGAVTAVMCMAAARYTTPIFLADMTIRHPENPNAELMWHCGVFAKSLAKEGKTLRIGSHYNRLCPTVGEWELRGGELSIVRFDGIDGMYSLLLGNARGTQGPKTVGSYLWIEVDNWPKWERKLIYGPYIHHCVGIHANITDILEESCRYIPGLKPDRP